MKAVVEIIGEYQSFQRMVAGTVAGSSTLKREFSEMSLSATKSAEAQVKASTLRINRMRAEITEITALASAYKRGSTEQIAAMTLVARKQAELNRLTGVGAFYGGSGRLGRSNLHRDEREASGVSRGLLSGAGVGHVGLAALSGGAFFGSFLLGSAARTVIDEGTKGAAVERQLATAITKTGADAKAAIPGLRAWAEEQAKFGVSNDDALLGLARLTELTGSAEKARRGYTAALEISKATGKDLNAVELAVGKALNGQTTALARYIGRIPKGISDTELLRMVTAKYGGQAIAATTAQQRFRAELSNSEEIIGMALLPTVNRLLGDGARWLDQMNKSGRLQRDVNVAVRDAGVLVHDLAAGAHILIGAIQTVDKVTGGFKDTLLILAGIKLVGVLDGWAGGFTAAGVEAKAAKGEVSALQGALGGLPAVVPITIAVGITYESFKHKGQIEGAINSALGSLGLPGIGGANIKTNDAAEKAQSLRMINAAIQATPPTDLESLDALYKMRKQLTGQGAPSATVGLGPHHAAAFAAASVSQATPKVTTGAGSHFALTDVQRLNLALQRNPDDRAAITAKIAYDKQAAAFAERRIAEGRGSKSLVAQLSNVYGDMNSLQSRLESLSKKSLTAETKATKKRVEDAKQAQKALEASAKAQQQLFDQAKQTAFGVLGSLGGGPVLTGPAAQFVQQYGGHLSANAYLQDITQQNRAGRAELTNLNTLRRRGAPQALLTNILGQGTAGAGMAQALAHATPAILKAFLGQYKERQQTAIQLAKMQVATMHVDKIVTAANVRSDAHDRPATNKFGRVPTAGRRR